MCTETKSEAAAYEFTTLTCIPGRLEFNGSNIQLLDLPGIIEGAAQGKGRGRQVVAVARTAVRLLYAPALVCVCVCVWCVCVWCDTETDT
jgi:ribosome-interacting GTPase 1